MMESEWVYPTAKDYKEPLNSSRNPTMIFRSIDRSLVPGCVWDAERYCLGGSNPPTPTNFNGRLFNRYNNSFTPNSERFDSVISYQFMTTRERYDLIDKVLHIKHSWKILLAILIVSTVFSLILVFL